MAKEATLHADCLCNIPNTRVVELGVFTTGDQLIINAIMHIYKRCKYNFNIIYRYTFFPFAFFPLAKSHRGDSGTSRVITANGEDRTSDPN